MEKHVIITNRLVKILHLSIESRERERGRKETEGELSSLEAAASTQDSKLVPTDHIGAGQPEVVHAQEPLYDMHKYCVTESKKVWKDCFCVSMKVQLELKHRASVINRDKLQRHSQMTFHIVVPTLPHFCLSPKNIAILDANLY